MGTLGRLNQVFETLRHLEQRQIQDQARALKTPPGHSSGNRVKYLCNFFKFAFKASS